MYKLREKREKRDEKRIGIFKIMSNNREFRKKSRMQKTNEGEDKSKKPVEEMLSKSSEPENNACASRS